MSSPKHEGVKHQSVYKRAYEWEKKNYSEEIKNAEANLQTVDRVCADVPFPDNSTPLDEQFFSDNSNSKPNIQFLKEFFFREGRISIDHANWIISKATALFKKEPNMLDLEEPITVCGDVHGQYFDLLKLFEIGGSIEETTYLFLGDYVDRGYFSCECLLYLYALKIYYPKKIYFLRGNHESERLTTFFTFKLEASHKYSKEIYSRSVESFRALPLAALVSKQFFCVHAGISPDLGKIQEINSLNRFIETPNAGLMCDLLWSDPSPNYGEYGDEYFNSNGARGCSYYYGYDAVNDFLKTNKLFAVIRAHEAQDVGYFSLTRHKFFKNSYSGFPSVISLFSAPNYCDVYKNKGAVLKYQKKLLKIVEFGESSHPYILPNFMNAFIWSLPFVSQKVTDMLLGMLSVCDAADLGKADAELENATQLKSLVIMKKIRAVAKMTSYYNTLREESENIHELKSLHGGQKLPPGTLALGSEGIKRSLKSFAEAKVADEDNEKWPGLESAE